jgi:hypothetical protein
MKGKFLSLSSSLPCVSYMYRIYISEMGTFCEDGRVIVIEYTLVCNVCAYPNPFTRLNLRGPLVQQISNILEAID